MRMEKLFTSLLVCLLVSFGAFAQTGTISGKVIDGDFGDELIGATVYIPELQKGTATDISGNYVLNVPAGSYTLEFSFVSFQKKIVEAVKVSEGEVTNINVTMSTDSKQLEEIVVQADVIDNNEVALLRIQQKSISVQDGISIQEIKSIGFSNSAESMKQVTGASVQDGKYVVMRGLGDRYSLTTMDGVVLPATNPYRNSASLDLIPTSMIDNLVVKKTFTPDLPGNFTGGAVNVTTRSVPEQKYMNVNFSLGYNDQTTFNNTFNTDNLSGSFDWLGFDDGSRGIPTAFEGKTFKNNLRFTQIYLRNGNLNDEEIADFNQEMKALSDRSYTFSQNAPPVNHGLNVAFGNRFDVGDNTLGYNVALNYKRNYTLFNGRELTNYEAFITPDRNGDRIQPVLSSNGYVPQGGSIGTESKEEVNTGGIASVAYQYGANELGASVMFNNNAESKVMDLPYGAFPGALSGGEVYQNRVLSFTQRSLINSKLQGKHQLNGLNESKLNWTANYVYTRQYEPDTRFIGVPVTQSGDYEINIAEVDPPFHFFRKLQDHQVALKMDIETPINDHKIKYGLSANRKMRNFAENRFGMSNDYTDDSNELYASLDELNGDYDAFFAPDNFGVRYVNGEAVFLNSWQDQTLPSNSYTGYEQVIGAYGMAIYNINDDLKTVAGVRLEKTNFQIQATNGDVGGIDKFDILPSLNFIYSVNDKSNLRFSSSQTLARPNMRELATFASFDLLGGFPVVGNPDLERTKIVNLDLRYELFPQAAELFAVSAFYKNFDNPIVLELDASSDQAEYQYVNTNRGQLAGLELELRKGLGFISPSLNNFKFSTNLTYIHSRVALSEEEFEIRRRIDPDLKDWRPFVAQSPYIVNFLLNYTNEEKGWNASVYANMFGPRLFANGSGAAPDIYEVYGRITDKENNRITSGMPVPEMNLRVQKQLTENVNLSLTVNNLLDYSLVRYQEDGGTFYTTESLNKGRTLKLSVGYNLQ